MSDKYLPIKLPTSAFGDVGVLPAECVVVVRQLFSPTVRQFDSSIVRHNGNYSNAEVDNFIGKYLLEIYQ
jgi:hypothetical protein